jgi:hypothetical protein
MGKKQSHEKNSNLTIIIPEQYREFRKKFISLWESLPFFKFLIEDVNVINNLYKSKLDEQGPEKFDEKEFIKIIPKLDDFSKRTFLHLHKITFEQLSTALNGEFPDLKQFFIMFIIYLLCNFKLDKNKMTLANMIDFYLKRPKKEKKKKKKNEGKPDEGEPNNISLYFHKNNFMLFLHELHFYVLFYEKRHFFIRF